MLLDDGAIGVISVVRGLIFLLQEIVRLKKLEGFTSSIEGESSTHVSAET